MLPNQVSLREIIERPPPLHIYNLLRYMYGRIHMLNETTSYKRKCGNKTENIGGPRKRHARPCKIGSGMHALAR